MSGTPPQIRASVRVSGRSGTRGTRAGARQTLDAWVQRPSTSAWRVTGIVFLQVSFWFSIGLFLVLAGLGCTHDTHARALAPWGGYAPPHRHT